MYWTKDGYDIDITRKDKYNVELYSGNEESKRKTLSLRVKDIQTEDFGAYTCVAKNYLGDDRETMILYGEYSWLPEYAVFVQIFLSKQPRPTKEVKRSVQGVSQSQSAANP